jgi:uncharacterized RDD family membrane protein YckC
MSKKELRHAGFWVRFVASIVDTIILALPIGAVIYFLSDGNWFNFSSYQQSMQLALAGNPDALNSMPTDKSMKWELLFEISVLVVTVIFWEKWKGTTPGKKFVGIKIVDAKTLQDISNIQAITRSIGYIVSSIPLGAGFLMIAFRKDKRALHDLLADTLVIYDEKEN